MRHTTWRCVIGVIAVAQLASPFATTSAAATNLEACNTTPRSASSFCITASASIGSTVNARAPLRIDLTFANTSDSHQSDDSDCVDPFTTCDAGHGVFVVHLTGTPFGQFDGFDTGRFGVKRVLNINDEATQPGRYRYRLDIAACVDLPPPFGSCFVNLSASYPLEGAVPPASASGSFDFTVSHIVQSGIIANSGGVQYVGSLDSGEVHLPGTATMVEASGSPTPLDHPTVVFRVPARCGTASGYVTFGSNETPARTVEVPQVEAQVRGCPTAAYTHTLHGFTVAFDGTASAAHVASRTVKRWRWQFGDGSTETDSTGIVSAEYPRSPKVRDYQASLVVVDNAGAISSAVTVVIHGTAVSLSAPVRTTRQLNVSGSVAPSVAGQPVKVALQRSTGGAFDVVATHGLTLNKKSAFTAAFARPKAGTCRIVATYPGNATRLASTATETFTC